jgi:hypothetical protein
MRHVAHAATRILFSPLAPRWARGPGTVAKVSQFPGPLFLVIRGVQRSKGRGPCKGSAGAAMVDPLATRGLRRKTRFSRGDQEEEGCWVALPIKLAMA